jgi:hypothetical protein
LLLFECAVAAVSFGDKGSRDRRPVMVPFTRIAIIQAVAPGACNRPFSDMRCLEVVASKRPVKTEAIGSSNAAESIGRGIGHT